MELADGLERFVERDGLTSAEELDRCRLLLNVAAPPGPELAQALGRIRERLTAGPVPLRLQRDIEGWVYPKLWKVIEAVRGGLPTGEQRERVALLARGLEELLAGQGASERRSPVPDG